MLYVLRPSYSLAWSCSEFVQTRPESVMVNYGVVSGSLCDILINDRNQKSVIDTVISGK